MIGVDVVDIARLRAALARSAALETRIFTSEERAYCHAKPDPAVHLAGTLAAKEATIKALQLGTLAGWARRIEIRRQDSIPTAVVEGRPVAVSISHDGGVAVAIAVVA